MLPAVSVLIHMAQTEAEAKLWAPCLVLAHVFAFIWLLRAFLLARTQRFIQRRGLSLLGTASAYGGGPHLAGVEPQSNSASGTCAATPLLCTQM